MSVRLNADKERQITAALLNLYHCIPAEFSRKPRNLKFYSTWKATEMRQFSLYTGPIVLKNILHPSPYKHFLSLHIAIRLLCNPTVPHVDYAEQPIMLIHFATTFASLYGEEHMSHNVHSLIHLCDHVRNFGCLDEFSAFRFENFMRTLKGFLRKSERPLQQLSDKYSELVDCRFNCIVNRAKQLGVKDEHYDGPITRNCIRSYRRFVTKDFLLTISCPNNCCGLIDGSIVVIENICESTTHDFVIVGRKFL